MRRIFMMEVRPICGTVVNHYNRQFQLNLTRNREPTSLNS
jgi:hypothetical protein